MIKLSGGLFIILAQSNDVLEESWLVSFVGVAVCQAMNFHVLGRRFDKMNKASLLCFLCSCCEFNKTFDFLALNDKNNKSNLQKNA